LKTSLQKLIRSLGSAKSETYDRLMQRPLTEADLEQLEISDMLLILKFIARYLPRLYFALSAEETANLIFLIDDLNIHIKKLTPMLAFRYEAKKWNASLRNLLTQKSLDSVIMIPDPDHELGAILGIVLLLSIIVLIPITILFFNRNWWLFGCLFLIIQCVAFFVSGFFDPKIRKKAGIRMQERKIILDRLYEFQLFWSSLHGQNQTMSYPFHEKFFYGIYSKKVIAGYFEQLKFLESFINTPDPIFKWLKKNSQNLLTVTKQLIANNLRTLNQKHKVTYQEIKLTENNECPICLTTRYITGSTNFKCCSNCKYAMCDTCYTLNPVEACQCTPNFPKNYTQASQRFRSEHPIISLIEELHRNIKNLLNVMK